MSAAATRRSRSPRGNATTLPSCCTPSGIFLPATAVDYSGNRIGQGGGYYDKFLAALAALLPPGGPAADGGLLPPLPTAAVVYEAEVLPAGSIPAEPFDRKVAAALTPAGLLPLHPG